MMKNEKHDSTLHSNLQTRKEVLVGVLFLSRKKKTFVEVAQKPTNQSLHL